MIAAGYMWKGELSRPEGFLEGSDVEQVCSVSSCISKNFSYDQGSWNHNGFWMYDSISKMQEEADHAGIDTGSLNCFYYEVYEKQFVEDTRAWESFKPDDSLRSHELTSGQSLRGGGLKARGPRICSSTFSPESSQIQPPVEKTLLGYDVVTFLTGNQPDHSPLSCNYLASQVGVNKYCLIPTFEVTKEALETGVSDRTEPGPFRIFGVYRI